MVGRNNKFVSSIPSLHADSSLNSSDFESCNCKVSRKLGQLNIPEIPLKT